MNPRGRLRISSHAGCTRYERCHLRGFYRRGKNRLGSGGGGPEPGQGGCLLKAASIAQRSVGAPLPRKEDEALLTGRARFIDDVSPLPGLRFAAILRSPHPHARIVRIDASRARSLSGVVDVVTGSDLA